jgi:UDP-N-acetylglucosamine--N-acetylmuramyl-(pentapeptide) pyrophosphoryl-undecaprenol N-acetylglucosamine transferase
LLVFGGSQGARAINDAVASALAEGRLAGVNVLWSTGAADYARHGSRAVPGRVVVHAFIDPMTPAYAAADLVLSRAGAMTIAELCAWGRPSVLVPLPTAAADHQTANAHALAAAGAAVLLRERDLSGESVARLVRELLADRERLRLLSAAARSRGHPDAARLIMSKILTLVS